MTNNIKKIISQIDNHIDFYSKHVSELRNIVAGIDDLDPCPDKSNFKDIKLLKEIEAILIFSLLDIFETSKGTLISKHKWDFIYFAKNANLTIYETINSLDKINYNLFELIINKYPNYKGNYDQIRRKIKSFKTKYNFTTTIDAVRNKVAAHIEPSIIIYFDTIDNIENIDTMEAVKSFASILDSFFDLISDMTKQVIQ